MDRYEGVIMTIRDLWEDLDGKVMELRNRVMFCSPGESLDCQGLINDMVDAKEAFVKTVSPFLDTTVQPE